VTPSRSFRAAASLAGCLALAGCLGPKAVQQTRARYNDVIQTTNNEELLLNLVRLRYAESPGFLPVTSLTAQFELSAGGLYRNGPERGALDNYGQGSLGFSDRPTISFAPQRSPELTKGLLSRIPLDTLYLFAANTGDVSRALRLLVRDMNGLENPGPGSPVDPGEAAAFRAAVELIDRLHERRAVVLSVENRAADVPDAVPLGSVDAQDLVRIKSAGYGVRPLPDGKGFVLTQTRSVRVMRIHPEAVGSPEMLELARLLRLQPGLESYDVDELIEGQLRPGAADPLRTKLTITTRSILEVMLLLARAVEVPPCHACAGLTDADGSAFEAREVFGDLFRVGVSPHRPKNAYIAVKYRGYWYRIDDADAATKTTLGFFSDLFRLQRIGAAEGQPLLTLPVGR
jgi:hypothetical protein